MTNKNRAVWIRAFLFVGALGALWWSEIRRPLRRSVESKPRRNVRNLAMAAVSAAAVQITERPAIERLTALVDQHRWGLLKRVRLPRWLEVSLAVILMDYTLYVWHVLTHVAPALWRFHQVHHVDLDLDASTALRFHFAELALSVPWRAGQVLLIGVSPASFSAWQAFLFFSILFHHSNVQLPVRIERQLVGWIVTPRMHGIHHSILRAETNSNWSSGLTLWDWLHGTLRLNVPQSAITIGVSAYRRPEEITWPNILAMPFGPERPTWEWSEGGQPVRPPLSVPPDHLLA